MDLKKNKLAIEIPAEGLTTAQVRLLKTFQSTLIDALTTDDEGAFFEGSAQLMRLCASLIQQAHFTEKTKKLSSIPYADQALEYSLDLLQEQMISKKVVNYDN
ncbi:MAG: hypothetical protein WCG27_00995 [Pseudomonadota bacterium]